MTEISRDKFMRLVCANTQRPHLKHGPAFDAVFDPFEFEGEEFFTYYESSISCWAIGRTVDSALRQSVAFADDDQPDVTAAMNRLGFLPAPSLPPEFERALFRGPFWYGNHQFVWFLLDMAEGWKLAWSSPESNTPFNEIAH